MKNLVMLLVAVLGTSAMVSAQTTPTQAAPAKEVKATKPHHHKNKTDKKAKSEKTETPKADATNMK